jgi:hypothetical protein
MAPPPIQFPGEASRVSCARLTWQPGPFKTFFEIGLFWIAALACLVAFSIWAL